MPDTSGPAPITNKAKRNHNPETSAQYPPNSTPSVAQKATIHIQSAQANQQQSENNRHKWMLAWTAVVAVAGVAQAYSSCSQWRAMERQGEMMEETLQISSLQQRPWVGVINSCLALEKEFFRSDGRCLPQHPQLFDIVKAGDRITTRVTVANVGTSPAMNAHLMVRWCIRDNLHHSPPPFESCVGEIGDADKANGLRPLLPNSAGDSAMEVTHSFSLSSVDDISAVREGRKRFFMRGRVTYDNGGTEKDLRAYHTDFCLLYDARYPTEQYSYYYCDNGQEAN